MKEYKLVQCCAPNKNTEYTRLGDRLDVLIKEWKEKERGGGRMEFPRLCGGRRGSY